MKKRLFNELMEAVKEGAQILKGLAMTKPVPPGDASMLCPRGHRVSRRDRIERVETFWCPDCKIIYSLGQLRTDGAQGKADVSPDAREDRSPAD